MKEDVVGWMVVMIMMKKGLQDENLNKKTTPKT
jgi:hypothetical protein